MTHKVFIRLGIKDSFEIYWAHFLLLLFQSLTAFSDFEARENWILFREEYLLWKVIREIEFDVDIFDEMSTEYRDFGMFTITVSLEMATSIEGSFRFHVRRNSKLGKERTYRTTNPMQMVKEILGRIALEKEKE